ncbi:hypothetical protein [Pseudochelatococcus sp. G4_1912]|uniref:hypothetical protein n=1 Tax=Pseudochelatococcus sp. G4_1912 TaxID=3114288 RepID=UPI0039C68938
MSEYISNRSNIISFDNVITAPDNGGASYFEGIWETAYSFAENIISRIASCLTDILWKIWNAFKFEGDNQPQPKAVAEGSISVLKSEPFISNILNNYDIQCSEAPDELSDALDQLNTSKTSVILPIKQVIVGLSGESLVGDGSKDGCNIQVNDCLPEHISNIAVKSSFAEGACFKHKYPFLKEIENVSFNYSLILKDISAGEYACIGVNKKIVAGICSKFFEELNVVNMAYHAEMMALRDIILFSKKGGERLSSLDNDKIASTLCKAINDDIENGYNGDEKDYVYLDRGPFILSSGTVERLSRLRIQIK